MIRHANAAEPRDLARGRKSERNVLQCVSATARCMRTITMRISLTRITARLFQTPLNRSATSQRAIDSTYDVGTLADDFSICLVHRSRVALSRDFSALTSSLESRLLLTIRAVAIFSDRSRRSIYGGLFRGRNDSGA